MSDTPITEEMPREPISAVEEWLQLIYEKIQEGGGGGMTPEQVQAMIDASIAEAAIFTTGTMEQQIEDSAFNITAATMDYADIVAAGATPVMLDEQMFEYTDQGSTYNAIGVYELTLSGQKAIYPVTTSTVTTALGDVTAYTVETSYMTYTSYTDLDDTKVATITAVTIFDVPVLRSVYFYTLEDYATTTFPLKDVSAVSPAQDPQLTTKEYVDAAIDAKFGEIVNGSY